MEMRFSMRVGYDCGGSPMLEFLLLRGLVQVTPSKKSFSWEYSSVTSLPLKICQRE